MNQILKFTVHPKNDSNEPSIKQVLSKNWRRSLNFGEKVFTRFVLIAIAPISFCSDHNFHCIGLLFLLL